MRRVRAAVLDDVLACVITAEIVAEVAVRGHPPLLQGVAAAIVVGVAIWQRRQYALIGYVLSAFALRLLAGASEWNQGSIGLTVAYFVTAYSLGRHTKGAEAWLSNVFIVISITTFILNDGGPRRPGEVIFAFFVVSGPWVVGLAMRHRQHREDELAAQNLRLEEGQAEQAERAVAQERSRIARELHDVVSHAISVTLMQARGARRVLDTDAAQVRGALDAIEQTNQAALGDMRRLLALLVNPDDETTSMEPAPSLDRLDLLADQVRQAGVEVSVRRLGAAGQGLPPGVDLCAYRIVQEALTNVIKHGGSQATADVTLSYTPGALEVFVANTLRTTIDPSRKTVPGRGLIGIRERVGALGGDVAIGRRDDQFTVQVRLPYRAEL